MRDLIRDIEASAIENRFRTPRFITLSSTNIASLGNTAAVTTTSYDTLDAPAGAPSIVYTVTTAGQWSRKFYTDVDIKLNLGDTIRWAMLIKVSQARTFLAYWEGSQADGTTYAGGGGNTITTTVANQWVWATGFYVVDATHAGYFLRSAGVLMQNSGTLGVGDVAKVAYGMLVVNRDLPVPGYYDGDSPGWLWGATPNLSKSQGFTHQFKNELSQRVCMGPNADVQWHYSTSSGGLPATITEIDDPIDGTAITKAIDVNIPADATRSWSVVEAPHSLHIITGEQWTLSYYAKYITSDLASPALIVDLRKGDGTNVVVSGNTNTLTTSWQRFSQTFTALTDAAFTAIDNLQNNLIYVRSTATLVALNFRIAGLCLERGTGGGVFSPPYWSDANGKQSTAESIWQTFDGGNYNDTIFSDTALDGGGVF